MAKEDYKATPMAITYIQAGTVETALAQDAFSNGEQNPAASESPTEGPTEGPGESQTGFG
jgi:hypothetical protein